MASPMHQDSYWRGRGSEYCHPLHAKALLEVLNETRKNPQLCDGVVMVGGKEVPIQRNVLSAASPFFRALFTYNNDETAQPREKAEPQHFDILPETFEQILDFIYTSTLHLDEDNIQSVLQAADLFLLQSLKDLCCQYLESCISVMNCIGIREFAEHYTCPRVHHLATQYLDEHFCDIICCEEFLQLPYEKVVEILQRNSVHVHSESAIFNACKAWVCHDFINRKDQGVQLINNCVKTECLRKSEQESLLADEFIAQLGSGNALIPTLNDACSTGSHHPVRGYTSMVVVAGGEGSSLSQPGMLEMKSTVCCFDPSLCVKTPGDGATVVTWLSLAPMMTPRSAHGLVEAGGYMFAIGGRDNCGTILNSGERYDPARNVWEPIAPMNHARIGFGLLAIDDKIYAVGGSNDMSDPLTSIEEFNIYTNQWRLLPDMNLKRAWAAYAVVDKKIFVMGGGIMGRLYEAVECFDPYLETWASVASMKERRFDARAIGYGKDIYVFGGLRRYECPSVSKHCSGMKFCGTEIFSTEKKQWDTMNQGSARMCTMTETSHVDSVIKLGSQILLSGDLEVGGRYHFIRSYNLQDNTWHGVVANHPPNQRGMPSCVVKIPNFVIHTLSANA